MAHLAQHPAAQSAAQPAQPAQQPEADNSLAKGWTGFLETLKTDQNMQMALLGFGTQLLGADQDKSFGANVSSAFTNSAQFLQQSRAADALSVQQAEDKKFERTRQADLDKNTLATGEVTRDLREAQTEGTIRRTEEIGKPPAVTPTVSDLTRRADALVEVDPSLNTRNEAIAFLESQKGKISRTKFISSYISRNSILGVTADQAADAWNVFEETLIKTAPKETGVSLTGPVTAAEILERFPGTPVNKIQELLDDPEAVRELESMR